MSDVIGEFIWLLNDIKNRNVTVSDITLLCYNRWWWDELTYTPIYLPDVCHLVRFLFRKMPPFSLCLHWWSPLNYCYCLDLAGFLCGYDIFLLECVFGTTLPFWKTNLRDSSKDFVQNISSIKNDASGFGACAHPFLAVGSGNIPHQTAL